MNLTMNSPAGEVFIWGSPTEEAKCSDSGGGSPKQKIFAWESPGFIHDQQLRCKGDLELDGLILTLVMVLRK